MSQGTQAEVLRKIGPAVKYRSAVELGVNPATLGALARQGLVEVKATRFQSSNPRQRVSNETVSRGYRLSMAGWRVLHAADRAAKASA
jgi:hypothetical protein